MALLVDIKVVPSSGRSLCKLDKAGNLKCYLKSPPEKGKANQELIKIIATALNITQDRVKLVSGATSRAKKIKIESDITIDTLLKALGIEKQLKVFE